MPNPPPADPDHQLALFREAVRALGGQAAAAKALPLSERSVRRLVAGAGTLHDGLLEDTAKALVRHADLCRELERQLSPAFASNLTEDQRTGAANRGRWSRDAKAVSNG
jgi:hypothetical protein